MAKIPKTTTGAIATVRKGSRRHKAAFSSRRADRGNSERFSIRDAGNDSIGSLGKEKKASLVEAQIAAYNALAKEHQQLAEDIEMAEMQLDVKRRSLRDLSAQKNKLIEEILAGIGLEKS